MNDIDGDEYMAFWYDSVDNGTLTEDVASLESVKHDDTVLYA